MADTKISALTDVVTLASGDEFPINDVSATTTKKSTINELFLYLVPFINAVALWTEFSQDLGVGRSSGTFDLATSGQTAGKTVDVRQTATAIASKGNARDEFEMDNISLTGYVVDPTTIRVYWNCQNPVVGTYQFAFLVST